MNNHCGYIGMYQPPLNGNKSSIYCVRTSDMRNLVMIPLVSNFFETAYKIARDPKYQNIYIVLPALDMLYVTDAYLLYTELKALDKKVELFCNNNPEIIITDDFYSHLHIMESDSPVQLTDYLSYDEDFDVILEFHSNEKSPRVVSDIYIYTNGLRLLFCEYLELDKLTELESSGNLDTIDQIHMPFTKNTYGGFNYIDTRRMITPKYLEKLYAFGFNSTEELYFYSNTYRNIDKVVF